MAEIKVEQKRGGLGWLWALLALVLIGMVVWYLMSDRTTAPGVTTPADSVRTSMTGERGADAPWSPGYVAVQLGHLRAAA